MGHTLTMGASATTIEGSGYGGDVTGIITRTNFVAALHIPLEIST